MSTVAPESWARVSSTAGSGWNSLIMFSLSGFISTHILTFPEGFGTTTIPAHHCDGPSIGDITLRDSIRLISLFTSLHSKIGTYCAACKAYSLKFSFKGTLYSLPSVPRPWKTLEYHLMIISEMCWTLAMRFKAPTAGRPNKLIFKSFTKNPCNLQKVVWYWKHPVNCPITLRGDFVGP